MSQLVADLLAPLESVLVPLVGKRCHQSLFRDFDLADTDCIKLLISKGLSVALILGGSIVKVPQIQKIVSSKSVQGISFPSYLLETTSFAISVAYNVRAELPFTTYGEQVFLLAQNLIIVALILGFKKQYGQLSIVAFAFAAMIYALFEPTLVTRTLLGTLQGSTIVLGIASRVPQILSNFRAGSVGQLSAVTVLLMSAGSVARVFTTLQEVEDTLLVVGAVVAASLNVVLAAQVLMYPSGTAKKSSKSKQPKSTKQS